MIVLRVVRQDLALQRGEDGATCRSMSVDIEVEGARVHALSASGLRLIVDAPASLEAIESLALGGRYALVSID